MEHEHLFDLKKETGMDFASLTGRDPYSFYDSARSHAPLTWDDSAGGWLVTGYDACRHIEMREDLFRHPYADPIPHLREIKGGDTITVIQGAKHLPMHRFHLSLFAPKLIQGYRDNHIRPIVRELVGRLPASGGAELASSLAELVPPRVILALLGMPWRNDIFVRRVIELHAVLNRWISGLDRDRITPDAIAASRELNEMLSPYVRQARHQRKDDLISRVWSDWPEAFGTPNEADVLAVSREIFLAGSETTAHAMTNAFYLLLSHPLLMERVRADRKTALPRLVEETLRLLGSVQYKHRVANHDCKVEGIGIKANDKLVLINAAANRDPAHYACPAQADIDRPQPRDHLAFNVGPRACVGAPLARAEMIDTIDALLDATANLWFDNSAEGPQFVGHFSRSFKPLHVLFDPAV